MRLHTYTDQKVPFAVRLADPGGSFHDMASGLDLFSTKVETCDNLTPHTLSWLRSGAIMLVEEETGEDNQVPASDTSQEEEEKDADQTSSDDSTMEDSTQENEEEEEEEETTDTESEEDNTQSDEPGLEELLNTAAPKKVKKHR